MSIVKKVFKDNNGATTMIAYGEEKLSQSNYRPSFELIEVLSIIIPPRPKLIDYNKLRSVRGIGIVMMPSYHPWFTMEFESAPPWEDLLVDAEFESAVTIDPLLLNLFQDLAKNVELNFTSYSAFFGFTPEYPIPLDKLIENTVILAQDIKAWDDTMSVRPAKVVPSARDFKNWERGKPTEFNMFDGKIITGSIKDSGIITT